MDFIREDPHTPPARTGHRRWRRLTEVASGSAKSVFHFDVQGQVAKSTHAGLPWLRFIRRHASRPIHFWPFDGWTIPAGRSAIVEVYPRLWKPRRDLVATDLTDHEFDAYVIAQTLREADVDGRLERWLAPDMSPKTRAVADIEGWILGVDPARAELEMTVGRNARAGRRATGREVPGFSAQALLAALDFAARKHCGQRRKDADASPYVNHVIAVARILAEEGGVTDEALLVAAILHDTVEDTDTTFDELESTFGARITGLVRETTDDKTLAKDVRKRLQIDHAAGASPAARQLKIADKIANIRDITSSPPAHWSPERKREYLDWAERVVAGCRGVNARLDRAFDAAVTDGRRRLGAVR